MAGNAGTPAAHALGADSHDSHGFAAASWA